MFYEFWKFIEKEKISIVINDIFLNISISHTQSSKKLTVYKISIDYFRSSIKSN